MHANEILLSDRVLRQMVQEQFPDWATLPLQKVSNAGTVNVIYRLGAHYSIRVPRIYSGVLQIEKEARCLPILAPALPIRIPEALAIGQATEQYPWKWAIYRWIDGENATREALQDLSLALEKLCFFIQALWRIPTEGGPSPGEHNYNRGEALSNRDERTRATIEKLSELIDVRIAEQVWEEGLRYPMQEKDQTWIHGDLQSGNILAKNGAINAIIDFGALGVGDKACDLMLAWNLLNASERRLFRSLLQVEEAIWKRARAWALSVAVVALEYYIHTNPALAQISTYTIHEIEKEWEKAQSGNE